jgi:hypothetical protein
MHQKTIKLKKLERTGILYKKILRDGNITASRAAYAALWCTEAEFLDVIGTKVIRVFLLDIVSHTSKALP